VFNDYISYREAIVRVGQALFGQEWIGSLSHRQKWLINEYGPQQLPSSILPGHVAYVTNLVTTPKLLEESELAKDRERWMHRQYSQAGDWLAERKITHEKAIQRSIFEAAFSEAFSPRNSEASKVSPPRKVGTEAAAQKILKEYEQYAWETRQRCTMQDFEKFARDRNCHGGRELLRKVFRRKYPNTKVGRPSRNNSPK
jgi:hypothetical protein